MKKSEIIPVAIATLIFACITGFLGFYSIINCAFSGMTTETYNCSFLVVWLYPIECFVGLLIFLSDIVLFAFKNEKERKIVHKANLIYLSVAVLSLMLYVIVDGGAAFR
jgi:hypothetical protein